jgi:hypothetical protein
MTTYYEIPLSGAPQSFNVALPTSGTDPTTSGAYRMVLQYRAAAMGGWTIDLYDGVGNALVCGIPLVTGTDLLGQYVYLNLGGNLVCYSEAVPDAVPTFNNLGSGSHLMWVTEP